MELVINEALQKLSSPLLDGVMGVLTEVGGKLIFLLVAIILYLCIDKKYAFQFVNVFFAGHMCVEVTKLLVARPRPYTYDSVISIGEETSGYSFPSGHTNSISNLSTQLSIKTKNKWVILVGAILTFTVMFTRVYLGQHFLSDVLVGLLYGVSFAFLFTKLWVLLKDKEERLAYVTVPVCIIIAVLSYAFGFANKDFLVILGAYSAFSIGYVLEKRFVKYDVKSDKKYKYVLRTIIALVVVLAIKEGLKFIPITDMFITEFVRYFIIGFTAVFLMPALFKKIKI